MKYLPDGFLAKELDKFSIDNIGIPSIVLMERAALGTTKTIFKEINKRKIKNAKVLIVCGTGNNGADGLAVARMLNDKQICTDVLFDQDISKATKEFLIQKNILENENINIKHNVDFSEYNCIVDAVFGIGLSRNIEGKYEKLINRINEEKSSDSFVVSIDIPSGINAYNGNVMGVAVKADITVTFSYMKLGMCFYPGKKYSGKVIIKDAGFAPLDLYKNFTKNSAFSFEDKDLKKYFRRTDEGNKGTFGKVLIIAGSKEMAGAAVLSAGAALHTGAGLVRVLTHKDNRNIILEKKPEVIVDTYDEETDIKKIVRKGLEWCDCAVVGPGLSKNSIAVEIVKNVIEWSSENDKNQKNIIIDADALNIISDDKSILYTKSSSNKFIMTPHIGEAHRLTGMKISEIKEDLIGASKKIAKEFNAICILKDSVSVTSDGDRVCINLSGNSGMATAGSGDVLTGIIAAVLSDKSHDLNDTDDVNNTEDVNDKIHTDDFYQIALSVYLHGRCGDAAAKKYGKISMTAEDIISGIAFVLKNNK